MFLVVMMLLWSLIAAVIAGDGREVHVAILDVALYGAHTGYWLIVGFALFDRIAREFITGGASRFLFALFAVPYMMVTWPLISAWPVSAYPVDLQGHIPAWQHALPFFAVLVCYLVRPDRAKPVKDQDAEGEGEAAT